MFGKCFTITLLVLGIISFLDILFIFIFYINYSTKAVRILFYINFGIQCLLNVFILFIELPFDNHSINNIRKKFMGKKTSIIIFIILVCLLIFELVIISLILAYNSDYWKNCPFRLTDDLKEHYKRRCELYNINTNSRYKNQFICSYDPTDDFKYYYKRSGKRSKKVLKRLTKEIRPDYLKCVKFNNVIENNAIVSLFNQEYNNIDKYYCSRTNIPKKYSLVNDKDCDDKVKKAFMIVLYCIYYVKFFFISFYFVYSLKRDFFYIEEYRRNIRNNDIRNNDINNNDNNDINNKENQNSTKGSEEIKKEETFVKKETKNIIVNEKGELPIEKDIKKLNNNDNINSKNESELKNALSGAISDEVKIKNMFDIN